MWERAYPGTADQLRYLRAALRPLLRCCPIAEDAILLMSELGGTRSSTAGAARPAAPSRPGSWMFPGSTCSARSRTAAATGAATSGVGQKGLRSGPPAQAFGGLRRIRERIETRGLVPIAVPRCRRHAPRPGPGGRVSGRRHVVGPSRRCSGVLPGHPGAPGSYWAYAPTSPKTVLTARSGSEGRAPLAKADPGPRCLRVSGGDLSMPHISGFCMASPGRPRRPSDCAPDAGQRGPWCALKVPVYCRRTASTRQASHASRHGQPSQGPVRSGLVPPLALGYRARPESVPGLEQVLAPGGAVLLAPGLAPKGPAWQAVTGKTQLAVYCGAVAALAGRAGPGRLGDRGEPGVGAVGLLRRRRRC